MRVDLNNLPDPGLYPDWQEYARALTRALQEAAQESTAGQVVYFRPAGNIVATNVQAAIEELDAEKLEASSYTASDVLSKLLTVDGPGSLLDADLLDGLSSAAFAPASHNHSATDLTSGIIPDARMPDLTGDVTTTEGGVVTVIGSNKITDTMLRDSLALSVIGRAVNSTGDPVDIQAAFDGQVLRRDGTTLAFGFLDTINLNNNAVTDAKLRDAAALSIIGRPVNSSGDPGDIQAAFDGQVLRRSGTDLAFGALDLSSANSITGDLPFANFVAATQNSLIGASAAGNFGEVTIGVGLQLIAGVLSVVSGSLTLADGDYGDVTASSSGTTITIDAGAVTLAKQANVATATVFYRKTAGTGAPEVQTLATLKTDLGLTGTNSGDQTITLTGDGTGTGTGTFALTFATVNSNVGTYGSATKASIVTVNAKGLVTAASEATVTPAFSSLTGLPTTLAGYGITDAQPLDTDLTTWAGITPGTGVATALAVNIGSAGAFVTFNGALGTPSSGTLTNCTFPTLNQNTSGSAATLTTGRTIAMTGDMTWNSGAFNGSANVTAAGTIANDAVTYAKMQNVSATDKLLGRSTAGSGDVEEIACTSVARTLISQTTQALMRTTGLGLGTMAVETATNYGALANANNWALGARFAGEVPLSGGMAAEIGYNGSYCKITAYSRSGGVYGALKVEALSFAVNISGTDMYTTDGTFGNFANDAAASAGGVPVKGLYRNGSVMMFRVA